MRSHSGIKTALVRSSLLTAIFALILCATVAPSRLHAQESHPSAAGSEPAKIQESTKEAGTKEARETKESGGETEGLKHSDAVRFIARITGLSIDAAYWVCIGLNFAIVVVVLWVPARKQLPRIFRNRTDSIQQRMAEARKTSEEARARLAEVEDRLSRLDAEIAGMRREAEENARAEEKRIMAEAEEERKRIVAAAEIEIASAANAARRDLKAYAGALAVDLAEKRINVDPDADRTLVREFTTQLGKDGN